MLLELLRSRRSIRRYAEKPVEQEKIEALVEAALRSPSSRGHNPWEFIIVREEGLIEKLAQAKAHGSKFIAGAPLAIVVCADPAKSDVWIEDASIAAIILHLTATDLGLGSCWVQIRRRERDDGSGSEDYVRQLLDVPPDHSVEAVIAIGYPAEEKPGHETSTLLRGQVFRERYGQEMS